MTTFEILGWIAVVVFVILLGYFIRHDMNRHKDKYYSDDYNAWDDLQEKIDEAKEKREK